MRRNNLLVAGRLMGLVTPLMPTMLVAVLMGVVGYLCAIFIPVFGGYAILYVLGQPVPFALSTIFVAVLVFAVLRGVLRYAEQACNHYIAFKLLALIRNKVFAALRRLAPAKLETKDKGNLISIITTDVELLEVFYAHTISPVAIAAITCVFMVVYVAQFHLAFALIALAGYVVVGLVIPFATAKRGRAAGEEFRKEFGGLSSYMLDSLRGLQEILQYGQGQNRLDELDAKTKKLGEKQKELKNFEGLTSAITGAAIVFFSMLVLFVGAVLMQQGSLGFGSVLLATISVFSSFGPVVALANLANNLLHTFASAGRVLDILDEEPVTPEVMGKPVLDFSGMKCQNLSFAYQDEAILKNFNLPLPANEIIGIGGKSGSGKSTLMRLLMRFWDVDSGSVEISDVNIKNVNTSNLRSMQSFVTQETQLFHDSIENNVKLAKLGASRQEVEEACKKASIDEFIQSLPNGYGTNIGELGDSLSGGEKQRIGLARAFLHGAPMILLDEPTSNLDSLNEGIVLQALKKESKGKTVVLVSHRASTLAIASKVLHMETERQS